MAEKGCKPKQFIDNLARRARHSRRGLQTNDSPPSPGAQNPRLHTSAEGSFPNTDLTMKGEFVAGHSSDEQSDAVKSTLATDASLPEPEVEECQDGLCPRYSFGGCSQECGLIHGEACGVCKMPRLHPTDIKQRESHKRECLVICLQECLVICLQECLSAHVRQSLDKECGICLENVLEKEGLELDKRFGILEHCDHCFCTSCIQQWRNIQTHECCPMCRSYSDIMMPSQYWITCPVEKKLRVRDYRDAIEQVALRHFFFLLTM